MSEKKIKISFIELFLIYLLKIIIMIKVFYAHGMSGTGWSTYRKLVAMFLENGIEIISPTVDYELFADNKYIFPSLLEMAKECDVIVGYSMGGHPAYHLGKALGKPTLLFNPAISKVTMAYNFLNKHTEYTPSESQSETLILMGRFDDVVDHEEGKKFLKEKNYPTDTIEIIEEGHGLAGDFMIDKVMEFALSHKTLEDA
jgi:hypothetical protein